MWIINVFAAVMAIVFALQWPAAFAFIVAIATLAHVMAGITHRPQR